MLKTINSIVILGSFFLTATSTVKVVSLMPYNGERIIKLHLASLMDIVDLFVIVESKYTFSGQLKPDFASDRNKHLFRTVQKAGKFLSIKIDSYPFDTSVNASGTFWKREQYQRDYPLSKVKEKMGNQSFILISGDSDELVSSGAVQTALKRYDEISSQPLWFDMANFMYSFKWYKTDEWQKVFVINDVYISKNTEISLDRLRNFRKRDEHIIRNSGWHCGYFLSPETIVSKLKSFSRALDSNVNRPEILNVQWVNHCIKNGVDILNRTEDWNVLRVYDGSRGYPTCSDCQVKISYHDELF